MTTSEISKAAFKARALEILRRVETTGQPVIVTDRGRPVVRIEPYFGADDTALASLRGSVLAYSDPLEPVDPADQPAWEALR